MPDENTFFDSDGVSIHYTDHGEGVPVVMVHGFTGNGENWSGPDGEQGFRFIAMDCRGHGMSDKPHDVNAYGTKMVEDVRRLMDFLELGKAHLVGYSMGAEIILKFGVTYPDRVLSLVMGGSGWSGEPDAENYSLLGESLATHQSFGPALRAMAGDGASSDAITDADIAEIDVLLQSQDIEALAVVAKAMPQNLNLAEADISAIEFAIMGLAGEHDPERANLEKMSGVVPDFSMRVFPDRDHMSAPLDPEFKNSIIDFLIKHSDAMEIK